MLRQFDLREKQNGAALIVGLILLVVVTILAVSGMNTATTELVIARNNQNYENAFQAAETGIEQVMALQQYNTVGTVTISKLVNSNDDVTTVVQFDDTTLVPDRAFSLGVGSGISAYHFLATATAQSKREGTAGNATDRDASAVHTQAFYKVGPEGSAL